jgi:hypothetical protein
MDLWEVPPLPCPGLDGGPLMNVGLMREKPTINLIANRGFAGDQCIELRFCQHRLRR